LRHKLAGSTHKRKNLCPVSLFVNRRREIGDVPQKFQNIRLPFQIAAPEGRGKNAGWAGAGSAGAGAVRNCPRKRHNGAIRHVEIDKE
jgi:hypothetical protein